MKSGKIMTMALPGKPGIIEGADSLKYAFTLASVSSGHEGMKLLPKTQVQFEVQEIDGKLCGVEIRPGQGGASAAPAASPKWNQAGYRANVPHREPHQPEGKPAVTAKPSTAKAPYTFVPVVSARDDDRRPLFQAGFHDGTTAGQRLSGELHLELTALTPLLVGQNRYTIGRAQLKTRYPRGKPVLEPAILDVAGGARILSPGVPVSAEEWRHRLVLIPGSSLKGALRQSLGAILNAPMERVAEHAFSYRPNLDWPEGDLRYQCREAIVTRADPVEVEILGRGRQAIMVQGANGKVPPFGHGSDVLSGAKIEGYHYNSTKMRLEVREGVVFAPSQDYRVVPYRGGCDGCGLFADTFATTHGAPPPTTPGRRTYKTALIPTSALGHAAAVPIPDTVLRQYRATAEELGDDGHGHLTAHPGSFGEDEEQAKKAIQDALRKTAKAFVVNQLIYVEIDTAHQDAIVSMGHNFRYRWRYADSVRQVQEGTTGRRGADRPELNPLPGERLDPERDTPVARLSGARLLFGYAIEATGESGNRDIGAGSFSRLAGRIAINHAIEVVDPGKVAAEHRFVRLADAQGDSAWLLPLKILGQPKPSAVEHYLAQDGIETLPGATKTYGDLPGVETSGVALNGRKFYRHQLIDIQDGTIKASAPCLAATESERMSEQATLVRHVSRPGTRFRARVRFREMDLWELGALLVVLNPELLLRLAEPLPDPALRKFLADAIAHAKGAGGPAFALKLGYARPLGFGSVAFRVAEVKLLDADRMQEPVSNPEQWQIAAVAAFVQVTASKRIQLHDWLRAIRWDWHSSIGYPLRSPKAGAPPTIFNYHTWIRRAHSDQRRRPGALPTTDQPNLAWPVWPDDKPWNRCD